MNTEMNPFMQWQPIRRKETFAQSITRQINAIIRSAHAAELFELDEDIVMFEAWDDVHGVAVAVDYHSELQVTSITLRYDGDVLRTASVQRAVSAILHVWESV